MAVNLDDYEVEAVVGKGAFGKVSRIKNKKTGEVLVWKELFYGHMEVAEKRLMIQEVNIFKQLQHQNIVQFRGAINDKHNRTFYLVQEHCNFHDLGRLVKDRAKKKKHLGEKLVWRIFEHCLLALCYMHPNYLHRDLKPQNIMLSRDEKGLIHAKIGDFGLSRKMSTNTVYARSRVGTPYYMAPEQIAGDGYDEKADIWSLGCILYEVCTFKRPFAGNTIQQLTKNIRSGICKEINPKLYSQDIIVAVNSMLSTKPVMRPSALELFTLVAPARKKLHLMEQNKNLVQEIQMLQKQCGQRKIRVEQRKEKMQHLWRDLSKDARRISRLTGHDRTEYLDALMSRIDASCIISPETKLKFANLTNDLLGMEKDMLHNAGKYLYESDEELELQLDDYTKRILSPSSASRRRGPHIKNEQQSSV